MFDLLSSSTFVFHTIGYDEFLPTFHLKPRGQTEQHLSLDCGMQLTENMALYGLDVKPTFGVRARLRFSKLIGIA